MYSKLRGLRKDKQKSKLRRIMILLDPEANPKTTNEWKVLDQQSVVENTIINRNIKHFGQAKGTPFTITPLDDYVDFSASSDTSEYILQGEFTDDDLSDITNLVIKNLQQIECMNQQTNTLSMEEFIDKFKHWKESTYTNPARHLGHYLALIKPHGITEEPMVSELKTKREDLLTIHLGIINYCLKFGYSLERWRVSITMMIEKEPGNPKLHRLRVIHIYETDYNLILGVKHRQLIHHMNDNQLFNDGVYSNRPGFSAQDPVFLEEMQHEYCRLTRYSHIKTDVDADSCYDRIVPSFGSLNLKKYGIHPNVCLVQGRTLQEMRYNLQTGFGISLEHYTNSSSTPIYGTGQGSAASPIIWVVILNTLICCHETQGNGAVYFDPTGNIAVKINVLGFVDDCSGQVTFSDLDSKVLEILKTKMQTDAQLWRDLLHVSGGELSHIKFSYHVTHYQFTHTGAPVLDTTDDLSPIQITINNEIQTIKKLSPYKTHKTLGCYACPAGKNGFDELKLKSTTLGKMLFSSDCSHHESWTFYRAIYLSSMTYPLAVSSFSEEDLHNIQRHAIHMILPKCGMNRKSKRALVYGPISHGGYGFHHLWAKQGMLTTMMFIKFWRYDNQISRLLEATMQWAQYQAGVSFHILENTVIDLPHLESKWINCLRKFLQKIKGCIQLDMPQIIKAQRKNDKFLMETIILSGKFKP